VAYPPTARRADGTLYVEAETSMMEESANKHLDTPEKMRAFAERQDEATREKLKQNHMSRNKRAEHV
jgi:hypothetical protein